jgi:dipeptidase
MLLQKKGTLGTADFMAILRDHGGTSEWTPDKSGGTICMHAADKLIRRSQSVCSLVGNIGKDRQFYYTTSAANPCMSPYYPIFLPGTVTPAGYQEGSAGYDAESFWWQSEELHRKALWHFTSALGAIQPQINQYEQEMISAIEGGQLPPNQATIDEYFARARTIVKDWGATLGGLAPQNL